LSQALVADGAETPKQEAAGPAVTKPRARQRLLLFCAGAVLLLAIVWYGFGYVTTGRFIETTDDAYVGGDVTDLAPQISGAITAVAVTDNQQVHAGDLLIKIDDRTYRAALTKARAAVAGDVAALANLDAQEVLQHAMIAEAAADVTAAQAQTRLAGANQSRYARLAASQAGTVQESQTANMNYTQANAAIAKSQAALAAATAQIAVIETQKAEAKAALAGAVADESNAQLNLGYTEIRAPVDGTIGNRSAHLGGFATAGGQLVSIVPEHGLWVDANFKEDQLAAMRPGEEVWITADVLPDAKITGHVVNLAPASGAVFSVLPAENATGNFTKIVQRVPVRIALDGDAATLGMLRPGLSVTVAVNTK
jgi:membrane fusion protein (multidrug efflux system)